jgi:hypothetical protein
MALPGENHCPLCEAALWAPDTEALGSKRCPRCGAELWVLVGSDGPVFFPRKPDQSKFSFLAELAAPLYDLSKEEVEAMLKRADSLDLVEFVMEIEDWLRAKHGQNRPRAVGPQPTK